MAIFKKRHVFGMFLFAPVALFLAGPRPDPNLDYSIPDLPDDLDEYLNQQESRFDDITPQTERTIVWADSVSKTKTDVAFVYLHGFSATRQEVNPLCDILAKRFDANIYYTRLAGHGRPGSALGGVTVNDWLNDAVEALAIGKKIGRKVILVGTSTGATLSAWLLAQEGLSEDVVANVMISPNFMPADKNARVALWPWGKRIIETAAGKERTWDPLNERQERFWTTKYPSNAIVTMMSLVDVVDKLDLGQISTPTLVVHSEIDDVVSVDKIKEKFPQFGSAKKKIVSVDVARVEESHVIAGDIVSPGNTRNVADLIAGFLEDVGVE